jgi:hypothetical protein
MKRWLILLALVCSCKKHGGSVASVPSPSGPKSTAELDALWAEAPEGAVGGFVMSPRAVGMTEHAWKDLHAYFKTVPELAPTEAKAVKHLGELGLTTDLPLADLGLAPGKGFALFAVHGGSDAVVLLPVADRDKFLAKVKGTKGTDGLDRVGGASCKPVDGWYACAHDPAVLGTLRKGKLDISPAKARGDIEGVMTTPAKAAAVIQLDRGAMVVRGIVSGVPSIVTSRLGSPVKPHVDLDRASGFAVLNLEGLLADVPAIPVVAGVTAADLAHSIGGPLTVTTAPDQSADARIPLKDPEPAKKVLAHCQELPILDAKLVGDTCHVRMPIYDPPFDIVASVDNDELRIASKGSSGPSGPAPASSVGVELANGAWQMAFWGHGTLLAPSVAKLRAGLMAMPDANDAKLAFRALLMLSEIGVGVNVEGDSVRFLATFRTGWANPDDVVSKLAAVAIEDLWNGKAGERGKAIADGAPGSPFAADYKAGVGGVMIPTAVVGILGAVAAPAFVNYMKRSKTEAEVQLAAIGKSAKMYFAQNGKFPVGTSATLPDFLTCCGRSGTGGEIDNKCPTDEAAWTKDKVWAELGFSIDEPTSYRYKYESTDGKGFTATATGDLDCDGKFAVWHLVGEVEGDVPIVTMKRPASGEQ